mgnify:CR=1 FL=1
MITITHTETANGGTITVRGHAGYAEHGKDIVVEGHAKNGVSFGEDTLNIIKELEAQGIEIEYRDNVMGYQPNPTPGKGGRFVIDRQASYSAWLHERQHVVDDENSGWKGFRNFMNPEIAAKFEDNAYDVEIDFAKKLGYNDVVKRLEQLKTKRRKELLGNDDN